MNDRDSNFSPLDELAHLPPSDPARRELESRLATMSAADRAHWETVLRETDELYAWMANVRMPLGLQEMLLRLPRRPAPEPLWKRLVFRPVPMWVPALCVLMAIVIGTYQVWPSRPAAYLPPPLDQTMAMTLARQMVRIHESHPPLQVMANDLTQVQKTLASQNLPFNVSVMQSDDNLLELHGGGVCELSGVPAAFTRWQSKQGLTYTLYQFDGKKLGIPTSFQSATLFPSDLWHDNLHYRVMIWPGSGGHCTWALVLENEQAEDLFCQSLY
jgi:hypothetical protein